MAIPRNLGNLAPGVDTNGVLQPSKGGTGATSTANAPFAQKGANSDITSLTGLTTPLSVPQGGTGANSAAGAPFAQKGANSDITSLTGLTTALSVPQGGTGRTSLTANNVILGNGTSAANFVAPGASGNVLTSNGTTWTSASAPASAGVVTATASGSIADGKPTVLNSDGTVSQVGISYNNTATLQTQTTPPFSTSNHYGIVYHPTIDRLICFNSIPSVNVKAAIGEVSGNSVTYTQVGDNIENSEGRLLQAVYVPSVDRVVFAYWSAGALYVRSYSATTSSITQQAAITIPFVSYPSSLSLVYDAVSNRLVLTFTDTPGILAFVINATATTLTASEAQFVSNTNFSVNEVVAVDCSPDGRILFSYTQTGTNITVAKAATVSNLTLSFGSETTIFSNRSDARYVVYIPSVDRFLCTSGNWKLVQVSGTTITPGSDITGGVATPNQDVNLRIIKPFAYNASTSGLVLYTGTDFYTGTFSTTAFTTVTTGALSGSQPNQNWQIVYHPPQVKVAVIGRNSGTTSATSSVITFANVTNLTATNYLGLSAGTYTNGQTATIQIVGSVDNAQTSLTPGSSYFVTGAGALSTTRSIPSIYAGFASSSTNLVLNAPPSNYQFIQQITPSNGASFVEFTQLPVFTAYFLTFTNLFASNTTGSLQFQFGSGGASPTYITSGYSGTFIRADGSSATVSRSSGTADSAVLVNFNSSSTIFPSGNFYFFGFQNPVNRRVSMTGIASMTTQGGTSVGTGSVNIDTSPITAIKMNFGDARTFTGTGTFTLYGIA